MRVVDVRTTVVGAPWRDLTFVELVTDSGLTGVGEVRMVNKTETLVACIRELADRYVIGTDPFEVERLTWNIQWAEYGRAGEVAQSTLSAFEVACWDLIGQHLGVPVWTLLGGRFNDRIPAYANGWYQGDREPSVFAELARGVPRAGYRALKVDPFGGATIELSDKDLRQALVAGGGRPGSDRAGPGADDRDARAVRARRRRTRRGRRGAVSTRRGSRSR